MATGNTSYTKAITLTLQHHGDEIFDAVTTNNALCYMLKQRGNIKVVSGGRTFTHPVFYKQNTSFKSYDKLGTISTPLMDDITRAEYPIKIIAGSLVMSTLDEAQNAGDKQKLIDLIKETRMAAEISMSEVLGDQVFKDGTAANDFDGIQHLINETPAGQSDVGGIDATSNTYWQNYSYGTAVTAFNTSQGGLTAFNDVLNNTTYGRQGPRAVITTKAIYQLYELGLTSNIRYVTTELADAGFRHLAYATMPVLFDDNCPSGNAYFIDLDQLWLQVLSRGNMKITGFEQSHNQLSRIALMYLFGNLTTGSRRTNGVIDSITG